MPFWAVFVWRNLQLFGSFWGVHFLKTTSELILHFLSKIKNEPPEIKK